MGGKVVSDDVKNFLYADNVAEMQEALELAAMSSDATDETLVKRSALGEVTHFAKIDATTSDISGPAILATNEYGGYGVMGVSTGGFGGGSGVRGHSDNGYGVYGYDEQGGVGVRAHSETGTAIVGQSTSGDLMNLGDKFIVANGGDTTLTGNLSVVGRISTYDVNAAIYTYGSNAPIFTSGMYASIYTTGIDAAIFTNGINAPVFTSGDNASIYTTGSNAPIFTSGMYASIYTILGDIKSGGGIFTNSLSASRTITAGHDTGDKNINNPTGSVNFAPLSTSLVVTNSLCKTTSLVQPFIMTNDATAANPKAVPSNGSFTLYLGTAPTAETRVGFVLWN